jgi:hypothetical protein
MKWMYQALQVANNQLSVAVLMPRSSQLSLPAKGQQETFAAAPRVFVPNDNPLTGPSARETLPSRVTCVVTHRRDRRWDCTAGLICTPTITC